MSTHIAEAASGWRTRVGIAFILLLAALAAVFAFQREAEAFDPDIDVTVSQNTTGPLTQGDILTYTVFFDASAADDSDGAVTVRLTWDPADAIGDGSVDIHSKTGDFGSILTFAECIESVDNIGSIKYAECETTREVDQDSSFQVSVTCGPSGTIPAPVILIEDSLGALPLAQLTDQTSAVDCVTEPGDGYELRHINTETGDFYTGQTINNNVVGARHIVCLVEEDTLIPAVVPGLATSNVNIVNGGGLVPNDPVQPGFSSPRVLQPTDADYGQFVNEFGDAYGATCISWVSTTPGDQEITVEWTVDNVTFQADWDNTASGNGALIKEWNVLTGILKTLWVGESVYEVVLAETNEASPQNPTIEIDVPAYFNPATSTYELSAPVFIEDIAVGTHTQMNEVPVVVEGLFGVIWDYEVLSECGEIGNNLISQAQETEGPRGPYDVLGIPVYADEDCILNDQIVIEVTACEPGPLGSALGDCLNQVVVINLVTPEETKDVMLAWVGQRVIVEHDWRVPPGDTGYNDGYPYPNGACAFNTGFVVKYTAEGNSVGQFLSSLGALFANNVEAYVLVDDNETQSDNDVPFGPQDSCISRVLHQSNTPGEAVIHAQVAAGITSESFFETCQGLGFLQPECGFNQTNREVVIYYMKIEDVTVSLVTDVSKPTHNAAGYDWAPGNPWDPTLDSQATTANVSEDVLVRVRVTGWFPGSNMTGRPARSTAFETLPAGRYVMPYDWPLLAGGPAAADDDWSDEVYGTAEDFSPQYDIMIAPNNALQLVLEEPEYVELGDPPFEGPLSLLDDPDPTVLPDWSAALSDYDPDNIKWTTYRDGDVDRYDAPMPPIELTVDIENGDAGFLRQVLKEDVYYVGPADNAALQDYTNPYYITDIPASPFIPAQTAGGGYIWNTWSNDGPGGNGQGVYRFWQAIPPFYNNVPGRTTTGVAESFADSDLLTELEIIRAVHNDPTISRTLVVYTDNHGEAMVAANGDFNLTYEGCETNVIALGHHCSQGDVVGNTTINATAQYPDAKGQHPPIRNTVDAEITWTWGGYKEVTVEPGETDQFRYVVFHALDRDGFCAVPSPAVSLHPVLSSADATNDFSALDHHNGDPIENVDFLIDAGQGAIVGQSGGGTLSGEQGVITGVTTFSVKNAPDGVRTFPTLNGSDDECQAWIRISNSALDFTDVLAVAHDDEGDIGFDVPIFFDTEEEYTLHFRWTLITWAGADGVSPTDALQGTGPAEGGDDIFDQVTAIYGWEPAGQTWLAFFPSGVNIPGANNLVALNAGQAYWIAIKAPGPVNWTVVNPGLN